MQSYLNLQVFLLRAVGEYIYRCLSFNFTFPSPNVPFGGKRGLTSGLVEASVSRSSFEFGGCFEILRTFPKPRVNDSAGV